jgi:predicted nucleotidyltransferase
MIDALSAALEAEERIAYGLLFGSAARDALQAGSDVDVAIGLIAGARLGRRELGALVAELEAAAGRRVDLIVLDDAPAAIAYRVFRDGRVLFERDRRALVARKARAIVEYLDFKPIEERCARGVLRAAARGR